ncbi:MAG: TRIC cation channel family protein [Anaerolineales bacterium]|nr:TRIC cation channel family protein [Anaerolineales bacterium]
MDLNTFLNFIGVWTLGSMTLIDLLAATTNAFNGAILASRPDHHRNWTTVGIVLIAVIGGIGGGVARDVLLNDLPSALTNPWYLILCLLAVSLAFLPWAACRDTTSGAPLTSWRPSRCLGTPSSAPRKRWLPICRFWLWS